MPLYYTLAYFGSGYLVLSFARRVSQVFQAVFSALFSSSPVSVSLQPLAGFPSASRPVQFAPTWWDPSHRFGKRRKKKAFSDHFLKFRCGKIARRCSEKHICKSKCQKSLSICLISQGSVSLEACRRITNHKSWRGSSMIFSHHCAWESPMAGGVTGVSAGNRTSYDPCPPKHLWYNLDIRWVDLEEKLEVLAPTGLTKNYILWLP